MYQNRIYGLKGAAKKMAAQNKGESPGGKNNESHPGPAYGEDTVAGSRVWGRLWGGDGSQVNPG